jgi:predicted 2-oxoglutarate/Fe(II)-dependent dioxygenase YbiX
MASKLRPSFATSATLPASDFLIEIGELGAIKLPLRERSIKQIIANCKPAKYGFRDKTLQDESVRKTWELESCKVNISNPENNGIIERLLEQIKSDMGLGKEAILKAELHNLLVYQEGDFFKPHQDTEKKKGMVATLTMTLPASHTGGALIVHHKGITKRFYSSRAKLDRIYCVAFYADCIHEVKPLTSGYRVVLTFNVMLERKTKSFDLPQNTKLDGSKYVPILKKHFAPSADIERQPYALYLLDHQYTELSFSWAALKRSDFDFAQKLHAAADALGLEAYLVLADIHETWDTDGDFDDGYNRGWGRSWGSRNRRTRGAGPQATDLIVDETTVSRFLDRKNRKSFASSLSVRSKCILRNKENSSLTPVESDYEGWMGNYGNTMEYWYRRAGVILWHKDDRLSILFEFDTAAATAELLAAAKRGDDQFLATSLRSLVNNSKRNSWYHQIKGSDSQVATMVEICIAVKDPDIARKVLTPIGLDLFKSSTLSSTLKLIAHYKSKWMISLLEIIQKDLINRRWDVARVINKLDSVIKMLADNPEGMKVSRWLLLFSASQLIDDVQAAMKYSSPISRKETNKLFLKRIDENLGAALQIEDLKVWEKLLAFLTNALTEIGPVEIFNTLKKVTKQLKTLPKFNPALMQFQKALTLFSKNSIKNLEPIKDSWSTLVLPRCKCELCRELTTFLSSPTEKEKTWAIGEHKRSHVTDELNKLCLPITSKTLREGSPHKLVLTKQSSLISEKAKLLESLKKVCNG